jgi:hypothetical protein
LAGLTIAILLWPAVVVAQVCGPADQIARQLHERYDEEPVAYGVEANGVLLEVYASDEGRTWTIVVTKSPKASCIVAAGRSWEEPGRATAIKLWIEPSRRGRRPSLRLYGAPGRGRSRSLAACAPGPGDRLRFAASPNSLNATNRDLGYAP